MENYYHSYDNVSIFECEKGIFMVDMFLRYVERCKGKPPIGHEIKELENGKLAYFFYFSNPVRKNPQWIGYRGHFFDIPYSQINFNECHGEILQYLRKKAN